MYNFNGTREPKHFSAGSVCPFPLVCLLAPGTSFNSQSLANMQPRCAVASILGQSENAETKCMLSDCCSLFCYSFLQLSSFSE